MTMAVTSNDAMLFGGTSNWSISFTNCVLFFPKCSVLPTSGLRNVAKHLAVLYVTLPVPDTGGFTDMLSLSIFGKP